MTIMSFIEFRNVCKMYPGAKKNTVENFNLNIEEKEFIAFVGPSGCGKSTTLRMVAGFEEITGGELYIDGKKMNDVAPRDRGIAMVFQNYALYPHMTVEKNIGYGLKNMKLPSDQIKEKVDWAIRILGLEEYRFRKPKNLSGGQRQRVALGRAIVKNQKVFLMDEPLSNLDAKLRVSMRTEISKLHRDLGATTIYVTHDQVEAMTMADRIVIMEDVKLDSQGAEQDGTERLQAVITNNEVMGNENNLYFTFGGSQAVARVSKYELRAIGDAISFVFMPSKLHFFDKNTGINYMEEQS